MCHFRVRVPGAAGPGAARRGRGPDSEKPGARAKLKAASPSAHEQRARPEAVGDVNEPPEPASRRTQLPAAPAIPDRPGPLRLMVVPAWFDRVGAELHS